VAVHDCDTQAISGYHIASMSASNTLCTAPAMVEYLAVWLSLLDIGIFKARETSVSDPFPGQTVVSLYYTAKGSLVLQECGGGDEDQ
jgi:hypothetical protein